MGIRGLEPVSEPVETIEGRRRLFYTLVPACFVAPLAAPLAVAQDKKPARIVVLSRYPVRELPDFRAAMRELGQVEGRTYVIEERYAGGVTARLYEQAAEAVRGNPDLIFAEHGEAALAAKAVTSTIPIVFGATDPVAEGLVTSLARPGGNATGIASASDDNLSSKRLEILRDAFPALKRVAVLYPESRSSLAQLEAMKTAAALMKIDILPAFVRDDTALGPAIETAVRQGAEAVTHTAGVAFRAQRETMIVLAARHRIPAIYAEVEAADAGGLMAYGGDRRVFARRAAVYIDRILRGASPAELPVERGTRIELVINLRTAAALGFAIPPSLVALADRVIE